MRRDHPEKTVGETLAGGLVGLVGLVGPNQGRQDVVKGQRSGALYHEGLRHLETDINLEFK